MAAESVPDNAILTMGQTSKKQTRACPRRCSYPLSAGAVRVVLDNVGAVKLHDQAREELLRDLHQVIVIRIRLSRTRISAGPARADFLVHRFWHAWELKAAGYGAHDARPLRVLRRVTYSLEEYSQINDKY